jgi:hypothetical protein
VMSEPVCTVFVTSPSDPSLIPLRLPTEVGIEASDSLVRYVRPVPPLESPVVPSPQLMSGY